ncbi:family 2 glycosyl transferase [Calothrix brevissima NIES-22]|nr:family 2 glycosyl transferase [Calothrix brevissima NIES-22]
MSPLVSIIIPCYNSQAFLKEAIASAIAQSYSHTEIIVVDDGSTDSSIEIIRAFGDRIRWETGKNRGAPLARNRGIELAKGEYIKFLDADDVLLPDCIEKQLAQTTQLTSSGKAIVYGDAIWINREGEPIPGYPLRPRKSDEDAIAHILANSPLTSCPLHKREYLLEIGGFDPSLPRGQEFDLHLRLVLAGIEFVYFPGAVYRYREYVDTQRISHHGYSSKGPMFYFSALQKQKQLIETQTGKPLLAEVRKILAQRFWAYGRGILREGYIKEAKEYFAVASSLDPKNCVTGNKPYPLLVKLINPYWAEFTLSHIRKLLNSPVN